jgi:hypothetical protein
LILDFASCILIGSLHAFCNNWSFLILDFASCILIGYIDHQGGERIVYLYPLSFVVGNNGIVRDWFEFVGNLIWSTVISHLLVIKKFHCILFVCPHKVILSNQF